MSGSRDRLCVFCRSVEVNYCADGPHERGLVCTHPQDMQRMASEGKSQREPGSDDGLECKLRRGERAACPDAAAAGDTRLHRDRGRFTCSHPGRCARPSPVEGDSGRLPSSSGHTTARRRAVQVQDEIKRLLDQCDEADRRVRAMRLRVFVAFQTSEEGPNADLAAELEAARNHHTAVYEALARAIEGWTSRP
jgi:hypothetical protein